MNRLKKCKEIYNSLHVSTKLESTVNNALDTKQEKNKFYIFKPILAITCSFCIMFVTLINISPTFANATYNIPIIGNIAKVVTIKEYRENTETELVKVTLPAIENTGNTELERKINEEIKEKIDSLVEESKNVARDFKKMVDEENDPEIVFHPMEIQVNYEVKCSNNKILSFVISKYESMYNFNEERFFYNINIETGNNITIEDILGENYKNIVNKQVEKEIDEMIKNNPNAMFFNESDDIFLEHGSGFAGISDNQDFYINEKNNVVIVFPKYSIAPGYMGVLEFEITK